MLDRELDDLPAELRWREWMLRVEAVIFSASEPVSREVLARVVGQSCSIELLIDDLREELRDRPYDIVAVAGGWRRSPTCSRDPRRAIKNVRQGSEPRHDRQSARRRLPWLGPRSPTPGAPYTYVTTRHFLSVFGLETLRELPDLERLEHAGLLSREALEGDALIRPGQRPQCRRRRTDIGRVIDS